MATTITSKQGQPMEMNELDAGSYAARRETAEQALTESHSDEYEDVHNGSGRSEEMPSDLAARHQQEWEAFEREWPELPPADPLRLACFGK